MTKTRVLRFNSYRRVAWKNGGGLTAEIATEPPGALVNDPFLWRLSLAEVKASGPFSRFPGYERVLVQLSGPPMRLQHEASADIALRLWQPHSFSGDLLTAATVSQPTQDFNCIVRRDSWTVDAQTLQLTPGADSEVPLHQVLILFSMKGEFTLHTETAEELVQTMDTAIITHSASAPAVRVKANTVPARVLALSLQSKTEGRINA